MDENRLSEAIVRLVRLAKRLRGPGGCPWDAKQTDQSVKNYLLEEAYEVVDAVEKADPELICDELGDLLFQIVFLAQLASERNEFDLADVVERIEKKMIRRHPHVFGDVEVADAEEVARNWARIKQEEKGEQGESKVAAALRDVPLSMPSLLRTHRLCERASKMNVELDKIEDTVQAIENGLIVARERRQGKGFTGVEDALGWSLFAIAEVIRLLGGNAEDILARTNNKFLSLLEALEEDLDREGVSLNEASNTQIAAAWERVKKRKRQD